MSDEYRPREHDHLVEPVFSGLREAGARARAETPPAPERRGLLARLRAWLRARLGRGP